MSRRCPERHSQLPTKLVSVYTRLKTSSTRALEACFFPPQRVLECGAFLGEGQMSLETWAHLSCEENRSNDNEDSTLRPSELGNLTMLLHSFNGSVAWYYVGRVIKKLLGAKNWLKYEIALCHPRIWAKFFFQIQFKLFKSICVLVAKLTVKPPCCWDNMPPTLQLGSKMHQITISDGPSPQCQYFNISTKVTWTALSVM